MKERFSLVAMATALSILFSAPLAAQRVLDIGGPPGDSSAARCYTDSMLTAVLAAFNGPAAVRDFQGRMIVGRGSTVNGNYHLFHGSLRIEGTVSGNVIVLDGGVRVTATGAVTGSITVIGGTIYVDQGAQVSGRQFACEETAPLIENDNQVVLHATPQSLQALTSGLAWMLGGVRIAPIVGAGQYNRVEALPIDLGASIRTGLTAADTLRAHGYLVLRTGRDPSGSRPAVGWHGSATLNHGGVVPFSLAVEGGATVDPTVDSPLTSTESGLSALVLRRDYSDWFYRRGGSLTATVTPTHELSASASWEKSHETTVLATDAFSFLRVTEAWRPNPLIDDGTYQIVSGAVTWDARDATRHPVFGWYLHGDIHHVSSNDITPVTLPTSIRNAVPEAGYGETDGNFDLRGFLRINPVQKLDARLLGGGYLSGDPLTIQRRRAIGGSDPMPGYDFRSINCDRRRRPDPADPALCDREMALQLEYRHVLPFEIGTRVGNYNVGIRRPDLVLFGDAGTAWLAGDSAGRVPAGRIQDLAEWRSDVGIGVSSGPIGIYIAKSVVDALPVHFNLLLSARF